MPERGTPAICRLDKYADAVAARYAGWHRAASNRLQILVY